MVVPVLVVVQPRVLVPVTGVGGTERQAGMSMRTTVLVRVGPASVAVLERTDHGRCSSGSRSGPPTVATDTVASARRRQARAAPQWGSPYGPRARPWSGPTSMVFGDHSV